MVERSLHKSSCKRYGVRFPIPPFFYKTKKQKSIVHIVFFFYVNFFKEKKTNATFQASKKTFPPKIIMQHFFARNKIVFCFSGKKK